MSASFKNAKKKYNQNDLRRLMNEHKGKLIQPIKKIESPLAKYNDSGQLTCILCKSVVRSEAVWTVHVNAKQHKENIKLAKQLKEKTNNFTTKPVHENSFKRPLSPVDESSNKRTKSILKNGTGSQIPDDFFDSKGAIKKEVTIKLETDVRLITNNASLEEGEQMQTEQKDELLPEGFFDDPKMDAKARNIEYKDPIEEEWDKFQKEMKEQTTVSAEIIAVDQEEATAERQIDEIDEQMRNWSRVLDMERKKELLARTLQKATVERNNSDEEDIEQDIDEFLDWRSKKSYK